jgi:hypothetical protein
MAPEKRKKPEENRKASVELKKVARSGGKKVEGI